MMSIFTQFIVLSVEEETFKDFDRADISPADIAHLEDVSAKQAQMIESRDFSDLDYLTLERAVDQAGTRYAHVQVKPNVVLALGDSVLVGSDGILINMSQAQAALDRFLAEVKS